MINSMTGYGGAEGQLDGAVYAVEIKTVNNRYFKAAIKLPDAVAFLEEDIEAFLRKKLSRGTINYALRLKNVSANVLFDIDEAALRAYVEKLGRLASSFDIKCSIDIGGLLVLPGIVQPALPDETMAEKIRDKVLSVSRQALEQLQRMRATEGATIQADLDSNCAAIREDLEQISNRSRTVVHEYHKKLKKKVDDLLSSAKFTLDETTLAREVALFAERADISEEISRLDSHLQQFTESCRADGQAGRRLDFISQEMLREANTIASKAADTEIIHWVVDMKCRIDRIKEQVQNVE